MKINLFKINERRLLWVLFCFIYGVSLFEIVTHTIGLLCHAALFVCASFKTTCPAIIVSWDGTVEVHEAVIWANVVILWKWASVANKERDIMRAELMALRSGYYSR